jgi:hypothetical protein
MNNSFANVGYCYTFRFFYIYEIAAYCVCFVGILSNSICIVVFFKLKFLKSKSSATFKYFLFRCIYDALILLLKIFIVYGINSTTYSSKIILVYTLYTATSCTFCSKYSDILAQFNRYVSIGQHVNKQKRFNQFSPSLIMLVITLFSFVFYLPRIFNYDIVPIYGLVPNENLNYTSFNLILKYTTWNSMFYDSVWSRTQSIASTIMRDLVGSMLVIILNILILNEFKRAMERKKSLRMFNALNLTIISAAEWRSTSTIKASKLEQKTTLMVIVVSLVSLIAHVPLILLNLRVEFVSINACFTYGSDLLFLISLSINLFIFFLFNNHFRKEFIGLFK